MVAPIILAFIAPFLKSVTFYNAYSGMKAYGFHRLFRRLAEGTRILIKDRERAKFVRSRLKEAIRFPTKTYSVITHTEVSQFIFSYADKFQDSINIPPIMKSLIKMIIKASPIGKATDVLSDIAKASDKAKHG